MGTWVQGPRLECIIFRGTSNLLEPLQKVHTVDLPRAIIALIKEVEGEEIILTGVAKAANFWQLGRRLGEDG